MVGNSFSSGKIEVMYAQTHDSGNSEHPYWYENISLPHGKPNAIWMLDDDYLLYYWNIFSGRVRYYNFSSNANDSISSYEITDDHFRFWSASERWTRERKSVILLFY